MISPSILRGFALQVRRCLISILVTTVNLSLANHYVRILLEMNSKPKIRVLSTRGHRHHKVCVPSHGCVPPPRLRITCVTRLPAQSYFSVFPFNGSLKLLWKQVVFVRHDCDLEGRQGREAVLAHYVYWARVRRYRNYSWMRTVFAVTGSS